MSRSCSSTSSATTERSPTTPPATCTAFSATASPVRPPACMRYDRLQLLLRMLLDAAAVPTFDEYEARRASRRVRRPRGINARQRIRALALGVRRRRQVPRQRQRAGRAHPPPRPRLRAVRPTRSHRRDHPLPRPLRHLANEVGVQRMGTPRTPSGPPHRRPGPTHPVDGTGRQGVRHLRPRRSTRGRRSRDPAAVTTDLRSAPSETASSPTASAATSRPTAATSKNSSCCACASCKPRWSTSSTP